MRKLGAKLRDWAAHHNYDDGRIEHLPWLLLDRIGRWLTGETS
jgi:hypothetical protein